VCVNDAGQSPALRTFGTKCVANCVDTSPLGADRGVSDCELLLLRVLTVPTRPID
jgi:hypothetical protein